MSPARARPISRENHLLAGLQSEDRAVLAQSARIEHPPANTVISSRSSPTTDLWFPHVGVIALFVTDDEGRTVQAGLVGPEGGIGLENIFPRALPMADAQVQITGEMSVIPAARLRTLLEERPSIQSALARFLFDLSAQSLQTVACNRLHTLEARCCRWLLMMRDRTDDDSLPLTQENLATMLGGGRPRINALLAVLEQGGLLQRYRGRVRLLSRAGLEARSCECYRRSSRMQ
jgi:CRP-like cAMP-binding protein